MTKDIYSMGWIKRMPKASKVDRSEAEFIPFTTHSGSNILKTFEIEHDERYLFNWME